MCESSERAETVKRKKRKVVQAKVSYVNVNRSAKGYKDKYRKDVEAAALDFAKKIGKTGASEFTDSDWKAFFKTILIPLDIDSEKKMIGLFKENRVELNNLLILHNTKAGENIAEVYFKRYQKYSPTKWYDLDDFKQMANEGLAIAAEKFDLEYNNRFLTYATWWILNKVRKPNQERGAMVNHASMDENILMHDKESKTTFGEVLMESDIAPDWTSPSSSGTNADAIDEIDKKRICEYTDIYSSIKNTGKSEKPIVDKTKTNKMLSYILSIVDGNSKYESKQIMLYLFKKLFKKCKESVDGISSESIKKIDSFIEEAPKSKSDLLCRINMDERQYASACKKLTRKLYDGI